MINEIIIYTDGACKGNPGPGGWGAYIYTLDGVLDLYGGEKSTTNNAMELTAAIKALEWAAEHYDDHKIILYTDSSYVMNGVTKWITGWVRNGWKTAAKKPVKNKELWIPLHALNSKLDVDWRWVKGHSGDPGNERADRLANKGVPA